MLRTPGSQTHPGVGWQMNPNDDLLVRTGVTIRSLALDGVEGGGDGQRVWVEGTVIAQKDAAHMQADDVRVTVGVTGKLLGSDDAVSILGDDPTVVNHGTIRGGYGIFMPALTDGVGQGTGRITNTGAIIANADAVKGLIRMVLVNDGTIVSIGAGSFTAAGFDDQVINRGLMTGAIYLGLGNDLYDGRSGTVIGTIYGGPDNDRFVIGRGIEAVAGDLGTDTIDFRNSRGVHASLDAAFAGTGVATGDTYTGIETMLGSLTGADSLGGDNGDNLMRGYGGNDTLLGGRGSDTINGGAGVDTITTFIGFNRIVFSRPSTGPASA